MPDPIQAGSTVLDGKQKFDSETWEMLAQVYGYPNAASLHEARAKFNAEKERV